ncbi:MAG TPA: hypothetical protein VFM14_16540 [Gemmatimonadales bacterium]|nr:hypothetical protein [Gemmatimonadales bacterium]
MTGVTLSASPAPVREEELLLFPLGPGAGGAGPWSYLPRAPSVALGPSGEPVFSLVLLLARDPSPDETSIAHLIASAYLSLDASLRVEPDAARRVESGRAARPAYARPARFSLLADDGALLASAEGSGPAAAGALSCSLPPATVLAVLAALRGEPSGLTLRADVTHEAGERTRRIEVSGRWSAVWDLLAREADAAGLLLTPAIERAVRAAIRDRVLVVRALADEGPRAMEEPELLRAVLPAFLRVAGIVLERPGNPQDEPWVLRARPADWLTLSLHESVIGRRSLETRIESRLESLLPSALEGRDWDAFVRLVSPSPNPGTVRATPRRARAEVRRSARADAAEPALAVVDGAMMSTAAMLTPGRPVVRPLAVATSGVLQAVTLGLTFVDLSGKERPRALPVITDPAAPLHPDRLTPSKRWYLPALEFPSPDPSAAPDTAGFLFRFERVGTAASGDAALAASLRITLKLAPPPAARDAMTRLGVDASPVALQDLGVTLSLPFVDSTTGRPARQELLGAAELLGDTVIATFTVADQWVRLAYGVLADPAGQGGEKARLGYAYRYECYRPVSGGRVRPIVGSKQALLAVDWASPPRIVGVAAAAGVRRLGRHTASAATSRPMIAARPIGDRPVSVVIKPGVLDPVIELPETYAREERGAAGAVDVLAPCRQLGAFYQERHPVGWRGVGCRDAFALGRLDHRLYDPRPELATGWFDVQASLTQPGRFLVVPRAYRITRYPPGHARAYRPCAMVYAVLDAERPDDGRYYFAATVEPDIPPFAWRALRGRLASYAEWNLLALDLPTAVAARTELSAVTLAGPIAEPDVTEVGDALHIVLRAALPDAVVLRTALEQGGVLGTIAFHLSDGSRLESGLDLHLGRITGPWGAGPVSVEPGANAVRVTNRVEHAVDVAEVRRYTSPAVYETVQCERRLGPGEAADVAASPSGEVAAVYAPVSPASVTLEESRIFLEDVRFNLVFSTGIDFAARRMAALEVAVRLRGDESATPVQLGTGMPRVGEVELVAPISRVVEAGGPWGVAEYRAARIMESGERVQTAWRECPGAHIDLTWDMLA